MTFEDTLEQVNTKLEQTVEEIKAGRRGRGRKTLTAEEAGVMRRTALGQASFTFAEYLQSSNPFAPGLFLTKLKKGFRPSKSDVDLLETCGSDWDGVRDFFILNPGLVQTN